MKAAEATAASERWKLNSTEDTERQNRGETSSATVSAEAQVKVGPGRAGAGPGAV